MARIRTVKPEFFRHVALYDAEVESGLPLRVAFAGLWTAADREGRFRWEPRTLKLDVLPHDAIDFSRVLDALATRGFVVRYTTPEGDFGYIPSWRRHQVINNREMASILPIPSKEPKQKQPHADASVTRAPRVRDEHTETLSNTLVEGEGKGNMEGEREQEGEKKDICAEREGASAPEEEPEPPVFLLRSEPVVAIPTNRFDTQGEEFAVMARTADEFAKAYPGVDVRQELREMRAWAIANPKLRKTPSGMLKFINGWLGREQDKGPRRHVNGQSGKPTAHENLQHGTLIALDRIQQRECG